MPTATPIDASAFATFGLTNNTGGTETFTITATVPLIQALTMTSVSGDVEGSLADSNFDGSSLLTDAGVPIYSGLVDNAVELTLMDNPFSFSAPAFGSGDFGPFADSGAGPAADSGADSTDPGDDWAQSDLGLVRVIEDLIEVLIDKKLIMFTDFPPGAQRRLLDRRGLRKEFDLVEDLFGGGEEIVVGDGDGEDSGLL